MTAPTEKSKQLDRIEAAIIGNGKEGLLARTARIEENLKTAAGLASEAKDAAEKAAEKAENASDNAGKALSELKVTVTRLEASLSSHVGTDHLSVLMKKKQFWALIVVGFIVLHIIATYVPNVWDWIAVLLGLPKLVVPLG